MKAVKGGKDAKIDTPRGENTLHRSVDESASPAETKDVNYSECLLQLVHPYRQPAEDEEKLRHLLGLGVMAWNMMGMKELAPSAFTTMKEETKEELSADKKSYAIIEKMLVDIQKNFAPVEVLIRDFSIEDKEGNFQVKVEMLGFDDFVKEVVPDVDMTEEEYGELESDLPVAEDEGYVNRNGISIHPKQPLLDWLNKQTPSFPVALPPDGTTYLLDEMDSAEEIQKWLEKNYDVIFIRELDSWHADQSAWPQHRSYKMFNEWFRVGINTMIYDLGTLPLEKG